MVDPNRVRRLLSYAEVDDERLAQAVRQGGLDDLDAFAERIAALVQR